MWMVNSTDDIVGHNNGTTAIVYRTDHISSGIVGQTTFSRVVRGVHSVPIVWLSWTESSNSSTIADTYKSATITVSGTLKNFLVPIGTYTQSATYNVH
ncbi:hypothetical protein LZZ85_12900 [Terrimonas sp. NA20]|uniref:Uncharacterized protein n=1 Tax=Terrimonas ginsenosidimutans TaxID=2908004 RepID=A0ABS9KSA2_9BACT|nr:hypothetical protein [Terrimonas ginsenosidimutans]MCG2615191.1 hypothetical protein [Terrimonas ginsenosidimutans]